jgi:hypothetical protein
MSEKKLEECSLEESTHVEVGGKVHLLENDKIALEYYHDKCIGIRWLEEDAFIPKELFPVLGIKPLREKKREPIEFEATFAKYDGKWYPLHSLDDGVSYLHNKKAKFRCVEILEDEE